MKKIRLFLSKGIIGRQGVRVQISRGPGAVREEKKKMVGRRKENPLRQKGERTICGNLAQSDSRVIKVARLVSTFGAWGGSRHEQKEGIRFGSRAKFMEVVKTDSLVG